jgi:hypothetical protein
MVKAQFKVAYGKKFCKAGCQIKNADGAGIGWGRETGVWGFCERAIANCLQMQRPGRWRDLLAQ